jgi:glycosyltransferase involved in cell wall biosynthesis
MRTLYLCYFGLNEPLVQTQVLPYLRGLSHDGIDVQLLTFEPNYRNISRLDIDKSRADLAQTGIQWSYLPYHKRPSVLSTAYDILAGALFVLRRSRRKGIDVLHARSHVPMTMALLALRLGVTSRLIFDIRGLMAEEYRDAGIWREDSLVFRLVKKVERVGIRRADQIVVLTNKFKTWLVSQNLKPAEQIEVIPCCVDLTPSIAGDDGKGQTSQSDRFEVIYAGSVSGLYLLKEMGLFFLELKKSRPKAFFRVLTQTPKEFAGKVLHNVGLSAEDFEIISVHPSEVAHYLRRARLGLSFRKATFSQIAASPTKIAEYLASGLPVVCNDGVGDAEFIELNRVGVIVSALDSQTFSEAAKRVMSLLDDPNLRERCVQTARSNYDLDKVGRTRYLNVYRRLNSSTIPL